MFQVQILSPRPFIKSLSLIHILIGADVLPDDQKLVLEIAKVIRLGFLQQNAFPVSYTHLDVYKRQVLKYYRP